jgi:phage baseplate assembly protein W
MASVNVKRCNLNILVPQNITNRYSDLNLSFIPNPVKKDIGMLYDFDAVKASVVNLVLTKHYERPFHSEIGCNVTAMLFDNITSFTALSIKRSIQDVIQNFEPRAQLQSVEVKEAYEEDGYYVTITFYVLNISQIQTIDFFLERLR